MIRLTLVALLCIALQCSEYSKDKNGLYVLNSENYDEFLELNPRTMVLFYEENDPASDALIKLLSELAPQYSQKYPELRFAGVDANEQRTYLSAAHNAKEFPQLRLYTGPRLYSSFLDVIDKTFLTEFLNNHLGHTPSFKVIDQNDNYQSFDKEFIAIYFSVPKIQDEDKEFALKLSQTYPEIPVYLGAQDMPFDGLIFPDIKQKYKLLLKRDFDEGNKMILGDNALNAAGVSAFVESHRHPHVGILNKKHSIKFFQHKIPIIVFFDENYDTAGMKAFNNAAQGVTLHGMFLKSKFTETNAVIFGDFMSITQKDFPTLRILKIGTGRAHRYKMDGEPTESNIRRFLEAYMRNEVEEYFRSFEQQPDNPQDPIKFISRNNFDKITQDPEHDVVVLFLSEYSTKERDFKSNYEKAAQVLKEQKGLLIAKANVDRNDFHNVEHKQLPLIQIFKKGKPTGDPVKYSGVNTPDGIIEYLEKHLDRALPRDVAVEDL